MPDRDYKKEFEEAYNLAHSGWGNYLAEAETDFKMVTNDQWDSKWRKYLTSQGRSLTVFNRIRRVGKIVTGYERRNRLALKVSPHGEEDTNLSDQLNAVLSRVMGAGPGSGRAYSVMSDAFECGPLISGINMVEPYIDLEGKIKFKRLPYNKFLLDPILTERSLEDCRFIIRGEPISKKDAKLLIPQHAAEIDRLQVGTTGRKFAQATFSQNRAAKDLIRYDEFWQQTTRQQIRLTDRMNGEEIPWEGTKEQLDQFLFSDYQQTGVERYATRSQTKRTVELQIYLQDTMFYRGPDPYGLDEYRFVPLFGVWYPEVADDKYKLQGLTRVVRDPQKEFNKRMSQQMDIIESQINSGYDAIQGTVVNEDSLYKAGQGKTTWMKGSADNPHGLDAIRRKEPAQIPASFFQLADQISQQMDILPGMNEELFGSDSKMIPGVLSKMRTGAALTILQDLFDGFRDAKCLLGHKLIRLIQKNYTPDRIQKMIGEQVDPQFYNEDVDADDVTATEGLLTDTQREMYYQELKELRRDLGVSVPDSALIDAAPMQMKKRLVEHISAAEEAQSEQAAQQKQIEELTNQLLQSQILENRAQADERVSSDTENDANTDLIKAKTLVELAKLDSVPVSLVADNNRGVASQGPPSNRKAKRTKSKSKAKRQ